MNKQFYILIFFSLALVRLSLAVSEDISEDTSEDILKNVSEDDLAYEDRLHKIYLKHYKEPISHSDWSQRIQTLPSRYKLKWRDNFWDLSRSFFKNPLYWSKMWVANPDVENPHLIYQGNKIKFDIQALSQVAVSKYSVDIQSQFPGLNIPENPFSRGALPAEEIPSSLPQLEEFKPFHSSIDISKLQTVEITKEHIIPSYLTDSPPTVAGEVISKDGYGEFIGLGGEPIIVKIDSQISIGSVYTVFENRGRVASLLKFFTGLNEDEIVIKGKIKILSYIQGEDSLYSAHVVFAMESISPGDLLFEGPPQVYNFSQKGQIGSAKGSIVGSFYKQQVLLSLGSIVYLNRGINDGLQKEDIFYIRGEANPSQLFRRPYHYDSPLLGKLKIIHSAGNTSTGIIISSKDKIYVGDSFTGESGRMEDLSQSLEHETIEEDESLKQGQDLLIDFEEVPEKEEEKEEEKSIEEESLGEDFEEIEDKDSEEPTDEEEELDKELLDEFQKMEDDEPIENEPEEEDELMEEEGEEDKGKEEDEDLVKDFESTNEDENSDEGLGEELEGKLDDEEEPDTELEEFEEVDTL